jgi:hypothetical protein
MHRKVDRRMYLLHALSARQAHPMCRRERASRHILRRESEGAEALQEAHDEICRLVEREFPAQTLVRPTPQVSAQKPGKYTTKRTTRGPP